jgi:hypothetical protein
VADLDGVKEGRLTDEFAFVEQPPSCPLRDAPTDLLGGGGELARPLGCLHDRLRRLDRHTDGLFHHDMQPRLQAGDGDDMVQVMGCDDVNSVQVACLFFQHRFVVGVNAGAFALKAFNPVGELLSIFPNGVAKGDDFQLVRLCLVDLLVTPQVGPCDATTTHHRQPHRSLTVTHCLIPPCR